MLTSKRRSLLLFLVCGTIFLLLLIRPPVISHSKYSSNHLQNAIPNRSILSKEGKENKLAEIRYKMKTRDKIINSKRQETFIKIQPQSRKSDAFGVKLCSSKHLKFDYVLSELKDIPTIFFITPTYPRAEQIAEFTRLSNTLRHIRNLHWIVAEDSDTCSKNLYTSLEHFGIPYTHLLTPMPKQYTDNIKGLKKRPRGVANRRAGIRWVLEHRGKFLNYIKELNPDSFFETVNHFSSVLYFGDDDNT